MKLNNTDDGVSIRSRTGAQVAGPYRRYKPKLENSGVTHSYYPAAVGDRVGPQVIVRREISIATGIKRQ